MANVFEPSSEILEKYSDVLVNFALNSGKGIQPGEVVQLVVPDVAKSLGLALQNTTLKAGAHPLMRMVPTGFEKDFFTLANDQQVTFFPEKYMKARVELLDHQIGILADPDPTELKDVDHSKVLKARDSRKTYFEWMREKENSGKYTWTLGLWAVQAKADIVGLTLEEYWQQIIEACFLDKADPVAEWRQIADTQQKIKKTLNAMVMDHLHITGPDSDLTVKLGPERSWEGGSGRNIPSFEFFTSPDWRGVNGWIRFNQPIYRYGNVLDGVELHFVDGIVTKATAKVGQDFLLEMLKTENANKIGEYSLTDSRMSRITHTMAETLFDENIGGPFGNTHLAIGSAYRDCFRGDPSKISKEEWDKLGYNDSPEHTDLISTADRTVEATLISGEKVIIYKDGKFTFV